MSAKFLNRTQFLEFLIVMGVNIRKIDLDRYTFFDFVIYKGTVIYGLAYDRDSFVFFSLDIKSNRFPGIKYLEDSSMVLEDRQISLLDLASENYYSLIYEIVKERSSFILYHNIDYREKDGDHFYCVSLRESENSVEFVFGHIDFDSFNFRILKK